MSKLDTTYECGRRSHCTNFVSCRLERLTRLWKPVE